MADVALEFRLHDTKTKDLRIEFEAKPPSTPSATREQYQQRLVKYKIPHENLGDTGLIIKCGFIKDVKQNDDGETCQVEVLSNGVKKLANYFPEF